MKIFAKYLKKQPEILRQGDVILIERPDVNPKDLKECQHKEGLILAYGEVTGHKHMIQGMARFLCPSFLPAENLETFANTGELPKDLRTDKQPPLYLAVDNDTQLLHEEHAPIEVKGDKVYEVRRQREYDITEGYRRVAD